MKPSFRAPAPLSGMLHCKEEPLSYDHRLFIDQITLSIHRNPCCSLQVLARELHISRRTIQKAVIIATGKTLRDLRNEILIVEVRTLFVARPALSIKEISFELGYKSARSFARAIRRVCGISPEQLRSRTAEELAHQASLSPMLRLPHVIN